MAQSDNKMLCSPGKEQKAVKCNPGKSRKPSREPEAPVNRPPQELSHPKPVGMTGSLGGHLGGSLGRGPSVMPEMVYILGQRVIMPM